MEEEKIQFWKVYGRVGTIFSYAEYIGRLLSVTPVWRRTHWWYSGNKSCRTLRHNAQTNRTIYIYIISHEEHFWCTVLTDTSPYVSSTSLPLLVPLSFFFLFQSANSCPLTGQYMNTCIYAHVHTLSGVGWGRGMEANWVVPWVF